MFGFGMTPIDKAILVQTEQMLSVYSQLGMNVKNTARKIFDEVRKDLLGHGPDAVQRLYLEDLGHRFVENPSYLKPRERDSVTIEDIIEYWKPPALLVAISARIVTMQQFMELDAARQQGKDLTEFMRHYRRHSPIFGDPESWDATLPVNAVFTKDDADIYIELFSRVSEWRQKTPLTDQHSLMERHTSFNAMVRALIKQGAL